MALLAPAQFQETRRIGAGATDCVHEGEILLQQIIANDDGHFCLVVLGKRPEGRFELFRTHVVGRRIDEIAGEEDAGELALDIGSIGIARDHQRRCCGFFRLVAVKTVTAETETEREPVRRQRRGLDMPVTSRQAACQLAREEGLLGRIGAEAEQGSA